MSESIIKTQRKKISMLFFLNKQRGLLPMLLMLLFTQGNSTGQPAVDSSIVQESEPPLPVVKPDAYTLVMEKGELVFQSETPNGIATFKIAGEAVQLRFTGGRASHAYEVDAKGKLILVESEKTGYRLYHFAKLNDGSYRSRHIALWLSILPPLVAIGLALIFKEVIASLFAGVWTGAFIAGGMRIESLFYFIESILSVVQKYLIEALTDSGHLSVIVFSLLIGGMVAIISRNGGMAGVVQSLSRFANSARSSQFVTWLLGVAIFFDDYANTLIVGNTMRSVTDRFKVSREKLAYLVDSTAAPVSAIAFITTWIGAELGYIDEGMKMIEGFGDGTTPYAIFLSSLKYSFYPVLTLLFMLVIIYTKRDFGMMYTAEARARTTGQVAPAITSKVADSGSENLDPVEGAPLKWYHAFVPVAVVILMTIFGLLDTGMSGVYKEMLENNIAVASPAWADVWANMGALLGSDSSFFLKIGRLIGASDSYVSLLWASLSGVIVAVVMTLSAKIMRLVETMHTLATGFKAMLPALIILTLAWSLAATTHELHTATYLSTSLTGAIHPKLMPVIVFVLAAVISFSTGSSWSTMAILYPIAIPTTWAICQAAGYEGQTAMEILLNVIAVVLAASVLGDHCSPISDTTILSSLASGCNHIDHVRTQLPYAMAVGTVSLLLAGVTSFLGGGWLLNFILLLAGLAALALFVLKFGKKVPG